MAGGELPLISLIVPVFNVERFVGEALESMASQTYTHIEVIVVDDASTDGTPAIVQRMCERDARFKLVRNEKNSKIVATLNRGLGLARGDFIARADGDDVMAPDRLERQYSYLLDHPQVALVGFSLQYIDEQGRALRQEPYPSGHRLIARLLRYCSPVSHVWLARREVYDTVGPYRLPTVEDFDFLLRARNMGFGLDNIPHYIGARVRVRTDNTVGRYGIAQRMLFNYAKSVNRPQGKALVYDANHVDRIIRLAPDTWLGRLHHLSDKLSFRASMSTSVSPRGLYMAAAALASPYKMQYYKNALMRRICLALWNRNP